MFGRNDLVTALTHYYCGRRAIAARGKKQNASDSFGIGFHVLKDHVLNCLMTRRCPHKSLQLRPKFHSFFSKIASIFKKVLHLKDLNRHLECTDVSFNPEKGTFSKIKK